MGVLVIPCPATAKNSLLEYRSTRGKQRVFLIMRLQPSALIASDCIAGGLEKPVGSKPYHPRIGSKTNNLEL
jgi:hypothetical protein